MPLIRCPRCGRVADGSVCFACGHEWGDSPSTTLPSATAATHRSPTRPPAQVTLPQDDFAFEIDLAPDPVTTAELDDASGGRLSSASGQGSLLADSPQEVAPAATPPSTPVPPPPRPADLAPTPTPAPRLSDDAGRASFHASSDFADATVIAPTLTATQLALLRNSASSAEPAPPALPANDLSGLPSSDAAAATVVAAGVTASQLAALRAEAVTHAPPPPALAMPPVSFDLPTASLRSPPPFDPLDPFALPIEPSMRAPTPPSTFAPTPPPAPTATPPAPTPPSMPSVGAFAGVDGQRRFAMPMVPVPTPPSFAAAFAAATAADTSSMHSVHSSMTPEPPNAPSPAAVPSVPAAAPAPLLDDEASFAGLLDDGARSTTGRAASSSRVSPAPTTPPPHTAPASSDGPEIELDVDIDADEPASTSPPVLPPPVFPSPATTVPFPPLPQTLAPPPVAEAFPPLPPSAPIAAPPAELSVDDVHDTAFEVDLASGSTPGPGLLGLTAGLANAAFLTGGDGAPRTAPPAAPAFDLPAAASTTMPAGLPTASAATSGSPPAPTGDPPSPWSASLDGAATPSPLAPGQGAESAAVGPDAVAPAAVDALLPTVAATGPAAPALPDVTMAAPAPALGVDHTTSSTLAGVSGSDAGAPGPVDDDFAFVVEADALAAPPASGDAASPFPGAMPSLEAGPATTAASPETETESETAMADPATSTLSERVGTLAASLESAGQIGDAVLLYEVQSLLLSHGR
jgi:hypothetical protein